PSCHFHPSSSPIMASKKFQMMARLSAPCTGLSAHCKTERLPDCHLGLLMLQQKATLVKVALYNIIDNARL
ncbi:hypothetical protein, partial [Phaeovulum veldkampii]|uniref:hypothetical protein n=1 Tax=Phaeovulum veldkampii TaxID=33049 RepID=UPI001B3B66A9